MVIWEEGRPVVLRRTSRLWGMAPQIEYATASDGARIAAFAIGSGPPLVIAATPPWSHVQQEGEIPAVRAWQERLAEDHRVVRYDCRGTGLSDRGAADFSVAAQTRDLDAVVDHFGLGSFALWGSIGGSPASITYAAQRPDRVSHLMLWGAYVRGSTLTGRPPASSAMGALLHQDWHLYTDTYALAAFGWPDSEAAQGYARLMRDAITQEGMIAWVRETSRTDVTAAAGTITTPTLVLVRKDAVFSGVREARELSALIPTARLSVLEGSAPAPFLGDAAGVISAIRAFVAIPAREPRDAAPTIPALTAREMQVLRLLAGGRSGKEIAADLSISLATAQRHVANIYTKIGARGRVAAAAYAFERGLMDRRGP